MYRPGGTSASVRLRLVAVTIVCLGSVSCSDDGIDPTTTPAPAPPTSSTAPMQTTTSTSVATPTASDHEVRFETDGFTLAGTLRLPAGPGPHPAIIMLHGSGESDRTDWGRYLPLMERFLASGFAVLSWDKPGVGESTGTLSYESEVLAERSSIAMAAIDLLESNPSIDSRMIGMWGISQAGHVMALTLEVTDDVAFMIVVGGPAMDSYDQVSYLIGQLAACAGATEEEAALIETLSSAAQKATTYEEYSENLNRLREDPYLSEEGLFREIIPEEEWAPEDRSRLSFFNPVDVLEHTTIPVLAVFGEKDRQVDPVQGAAAVREALERAGNHNVRVEIIPGVDHTIVLSDTGCLSEQATVSDADRVAYPSTYLDLLEDWLAQLLPTTP